MVYLHVDKLSEIAILLIFNQPHSFNTNPRRLEFYYMVIDHHWTDVFYCFDIRSCYFVI